MIASNEGSLQLLQMRVHLWNLLLTLVSAQSLKFISLGDWGYIGYLQSSVAQQMAKTIKQVDVSFILAIGDNFTK